MRAPRDFDTLAEEQAERELIASDRRKGGAYEIATARDPEFRSMPDQPLPDRYYAEAARVAATLGQDAATAMLQAAQSRYMAARIDAEKARLKALKARSFGETVASFAWHALVASLAALALHAALSLGFAPAAVASADYALCGGALAWTLFSLRAPFA